MLRRGGLGPVYRKLWTEIAHTEVQHELLLPAAEVVSVS